MVQRRTMSSIDTSVNAAQQGRAMLFIREQHALNLLGGRVRAHELGLGSLAVSTNTLGADVFRSISDQFDPQRVRNYRSLKATLAQLRARRRLIKSQLSKGAFAAIVKRHTYYYSKRFFTGRTVVSEQRQPLHKVTDYIDTLVSNAEYYERRLVSQAGLTVQQRTSLRALRDYYRKNPEKDSPDARTWRVAVGWHWESYGVPDALRPQLGTKVRSRKVYSRKTVAYKDWSLIRADWLRKRSSVEEQLKVVQRSIDQVSDSMRKYLPAWSRPDAPVSSNECSAYSQNTPIATPRSTVGLHLLKWDHPDAPSGIWCEYWWDRAFRSCYQDPYPALFVKNSDVNVERWYFGRLDRLAPGCFDGTGNPVSSKLSELRYYLARYGTTGLPGLFLGKPEYDRPEAYWTDKFRLNSWSPLAARRWGALFERSPETGDLELKDWTGLLARPPQASGDNRIQPIEADAPLSTTIVSDDSADSHLSYEERARNIRTLAHHRLINLDLRADEIEWDYVRSVGELKDLPNSVTTLVSFITFLERAKGRNYYEIRGDGPMRVSFLKSTPRTYAQKIGVRVISRKISAAATLAQLCALYLAWKFGLEQTLADTDTLARRVTRGWNGIRDGLSLIYSHLDNGKRFHPLRRQWSLGHPDLPRTPRTRKFLDNGIWKKRIVPQSVELEIPAAPDGRWDRTSEILLADSYEAVLRGQYSALPKAPGTDVPIAFSSDGLVVVPISLCFVHEGRWSQQDLDAASEWCLHETESRIYSEIRDHVGNDLELHIRRVSKGVLYANYAYKTLSKALRWSWRNRLAYTGFTAAWELAPLSFVAEWVVNLRQIIESANALLSSTLMKLNPTGKVWESIQTRYWYSVVRRDLEVQWSLSTPDVNSSEYTFAVDSTFLDPRTMDVARSYTLLWRFPTRFVVTINARLRRPRVRKPFWLSDLRTYSRTPSDIGKNDLPSREVRVNINGGKLGSLLAMAVSAFRKR